MIKWQKQLEGDETITWTERDVEGTIEMGVCHFHDGMGCAASNGAIRNRLGIMSTELNVLGEWEQNKME